MKLFFRAGPGAALKRPAATLGCRPILDVREGQTHDRLFETAGRRDGVRSAWTFGTARHSTDRAGVQRKKYQAAKSAGTLNGQKWNDFRKAQCGAAATTPEAAETPAPKTAAPSATSAGNAVFPSAVSPKYASEFELARGAGTLALINTRPTRPPTPMAG